MKIIMRICIILITFSCLLRIGSCETSDDLIQKWNDWRAFWHDEEKWDGSTYEVSIPEDPNFWWREPDKKRENLYSTAYTCNTPSNYYAVVDGVLFSADMRTLYKYPPMKPGWYYLVPSTVECIEAEAFMDNYYLQEVIVCDSTKYINEGAFSRSRIKRLHIPESVISFDLESITKMILLEELIVEEGSTCWKELKCAEDSDYTDFFSRKIVHAY